MRVEVGQRQLLLTPMLNMKIRSSSPQTEPRSILLNLMNPKNSHYILELLIPKTERTRGHKICLPAFEWSWTLAQ